MKTLPLFQILPKLNLGRYKIQKMGQIGSTEMYLIWEVFGITLMSSGLIIITGSSFSTRVTNRSKAQVNQDHINQEVPVVS